MALLDVLTLPDPRLRQMAKPVATIDERVLTTLDDMLKTMYHGDGCGLAGPQVAILERLVVLDVAAWGEKPTPLKLINPEITWTSKEKQTITDGCLSVPGYWAKVKRPAQISYQYLDEKGNLVQKNKVGGLEAACVHHEIDHLNGVLFIDHLSRLKRSVILKKFEKQTEQNFVQ